MELFTIMSREVYNDVTKVYNEELTKTVIYYDTRSYTNLTNESPWSAHMTVKSLYIHSRTKGPVELGVMTL